MRGSILIVLAAVLGLATNATPARGAWVKITGGKLGPWVTSPGPPNSGPGPRGAVEIRVRNLPTGWAAGAGCHTVKHADHPRVEFGFSAGVDNGAKVTAAGYALDGGPKSPLPANTLITLCRDKSGRITNFTAQLVYYKFVTNAIYDYNVSAQNTSRVSGSSSVGNGEYLDGHVTSTTSSSNAVNHLEHAQ
jgi:hypothetical protein